MESKIGKTRVLYRVFCALLPVLCFLEAPALSQTTQARSKFLINADHPFVYVKFDHIGPGIPRSEDEPNLRIWLRLTNNCRIPILVRANGVPDESPKDEVGVQYAVVPNPEVEGAVVFDKPGSKEAAGQQRPQVEVQEMPRGYMFHVASLVRIEPGSDMLFSLPANHLSDKWHIEIPFEFELPKGEGLPKRKGPRDPVNGGIPTMVLNYSLWDLPPKSQAEIVKK